MSVTPVTIRPYGYSEVSPFNDCRDRDFAGFNNEISDADGKRRENWRADTAKYANRSIRSHIVELILKIPSYFISKSDLKNEWWAKGIFLAERLTGTFGDMFRNWIYGHKDTSGNYDDNVGAEIKAGADPNCSFGVINNHLQTKGKFLVEALGLFSPELANDIEWAVVRAFDGVWWRDMGMHLAYGPNFGRRALQAVTGAKGTAEDEQNKITFGFIWDKVKEHFSNAWQASKKLGSSEDFGINYLSACQNWDKFISSFLPVVNVLNIVGDLGRPIARRLGLTGLPRNTFRILSVIDRPFSWFINLFRFYLPEKHTEKSHTAKNEQGASNPLSYSDLLLGSTLGDIVDFGMILFEDKIKDRSGNFNHIVEIARRIKDSAQDIYFSYRRTRALHESPKSAVES